MMMMKAALLLLFVNLFFIPGFHSKPRIGILNYWNLKFNSSLSRLRISQEHRFLQKLDHFDRGDDQKWYQRYWTHSSLYKPGGPAFLFVNGETTASANWTVGYADYWVSYAEELNAYCFSLEHRFYGKSWPKNGNMVRHLSSEQAIADIANFIQSATKLHHLPTDTKWIVFGCSYAGSLAAWARLKYPHLVFGAVASSAPLLAKADYSEYHQVVEKSLNSYHPKCVESIALASQELIRLNETEDGRKNISRHFHLPKSDEDEETDVLQEVFFAVLGIITTAVQYNYNTIVDIPTVCDIMINPNRTKYKSLAKVKKLSEEVDDNDDDGLINDQSWKYQTCSEFGFFQSIGESLALFAGNFSYPVEKIVKEDCEQFFGPDIALHDINERIRHTNTLYGGLNFNVDRTLFVYGSLDPWHVLGPHTKKNDSLYQTIFINGSSHCADSCYPSIDPDMQELTDARKKILEILKVWLKTN